MQELKINLTKKNVLILLILILIVGAILRFYGLENQSFWNDELSSWKRSSYDNLFSVIDKGVRPDVHPPGYQIFLYFVEKYIGDSESILRFPSAVSGVLSILAIFLVGLRLYSYKEGLIASVFMAVLWCPIYYSQEARPYSMLLLFTLLATYFWISILGSLKEKTRPSYYTIFAYIIAAIVSSYLHYFGLYLIFLQGISAILFSTRRRQVLIYSLLIYFLILLAYLPWLQTMWEHLDKERLWIKLPGNIIITFVLYLRFLFNESKGLLLFVMTLYSFLFLRSLYNILKEYKNIRITLLSPSMLLVLWLIVPFIGVYIESSISTPVLTFRNLIISLPAAYLLLSRSITQLPLRSRYNTIVITAIVGLLLFHLISHMNYYSKPHKEQFREAVNYIVEHDYLYKDSLIIGYVLNREYFNYYFKRKNSDRRVNVIGGEEKDIPKIDEVISTENPLYIWYIWAHRIPDAKFIDFLNKRLTFIERKEFIKADVWLFEG